MTDKEIIIDGVNVSECFHYINNKEYTCRLNHTPFHYRHCEENPNCYYKQLQRKATECEELKNKLNEYERAGGILDEGEAWYGLAKRYRQALDEKINRAVIDTESERANEYEKALAPFNDEYFKGLDTKQIAELAKKSIRLTTENRKLENKLSDIAGICSQILDGEDYVRRIAKTILDIID